MTQLDKAIQLSIQNPEENILYNMKSSFPINEASENDNFEKLTSAPVPVDLSSVLENQQKEDTSLNQN
jgi:hypothetical protein